MSNALNEMTPALLTTVTHATQTIDWIVRSRKFIEKCAPDTTNYFHSSVRNDASTDGVLTLFTTVIRMEARQ
jgi:hypothetical protein